MSGADWAEAIGVPLDESGRPSAAGIAANIRAAARAAGSLRRGQITRGLNEAFAPFALHDGETPAAIDQVVQDLVLIGDLTEFKTAAGAAYTLTPPRLVLIDEFYATLLGAGDLEPGGSHPARQLSRPDWPSDDAVARIDLRAEIGIAEWRLLLVEVGGVDAHLGTPEALFSHVGRLSARGDRLETLTADKVRVLSGRQPFFGRHDSVQPEGRWQAASSDGTFCAVRHAGHGWRAGVVTINAGRAAIWETADWDLWRWAIVGQTLAQGDPVCSFDEKTSEFTGLVHLPRQVRRLLAIAAERIGPWRWRTPAAAASAAETLLTGRPY